MAAAIDRSMLPPGPTGPSALVATRFLLRGPRFLEECRARSGIMKRASILALVVTAIVATATLNLRAQGRVIEIEGTDMMKYSVTEIEAEPGEEITVRLATVGQMPKIAMAHNFVLLALNADVAAFAQEAALASATAYIPEKRKGEVLASTDMAGAGETVEVTFTAPTEPGSYTFLCSFPGHFAAGMRGTLVVQ